MSSVKRPQLARHAASVAAGAGAGDGARITPHAATCHAPPQPVASSGLMAAPTAATGGARAKAAARATAADANAVVRAAPPLEPLHKFTTICARGLVGEVRHVAATPALVVTMRDLWETHGLRRHFTTTGHPSGELLEGYTVHFVDSLEDAVLSAVARKLAARGGRGALRTVIGLGGGQAIDVAKYFKWKTGAGLLFQLPTALTVDAPWGHRAAIRFSGVVRYVGFAVPTAIYVDLDVLARAPPALIRSGVGDVLCLHTAHRDWELATRAGRAGVWPYDPAVAAQARAVLDKLLERASDVRKLNDAGISALVEALAYGGAAFHAHGWNPRPVEGFDHIFFYCLEKITRKHFIHGYPVLLGVWLGARLQKNNAPWVLDTILNLNIDIRPEAMGITWDDVCSTLTSVKTFAEDNNMLYTVANEVEVTEEWMATAKEELYGAYDTSAGQRRLTSRL